ncbi:Tat pathway signal sequence [Thermophilibacter sp.]
MASGPDLRELLERLRRQASAGAGAKAAPASGPSLGERLARGGKRVLVALLVVAALALAACYWWFHPAINLGSLQVWTWVAGICVVALLALGVAAAHSPLRGRLYRRLMVLPAAPLVCLVLGLVMSQPFFPGNAERYASVLTTTDGVFDEDIEEVDYAEVPVIDRDSAILLGNRAMGSIPEYVSQFEIADTYSMINYQGRPVRVSPLVYADVFKWWANRDAGIPAYVLVDMVTQEATVVRLDQPILYSDSEPFARNVDRHVQLSHPSYLFDQKSFELDEEGTPWWVYPVQRKTIGLFGGTTVARVVLVNACTGETVDYAVEDVPTWVDRAYPSDLLIEQYNWSGAYSGGWLNSWLGQEGVVRTTPGTNGQLGYNYLAQGDDIYLYTGVTSVTADDSSVGFILVNQRTGESHFYPVSGATEASAMASAEGQLQNLRYQATYPILLNVAGQPTYFVSLKDDAGLVKMFAMINIEQYQSVATGSTVEECQESYLALLSADGLLSDEEAAEAATTVELSGQIATIAQAVVDGNSHFYVTLEGDEGAIYDFALPGMLEIVTYQPGDAIAFRVAEKDVGAPVVTVTELL